MIRVAPRARNPIPPLALALALLWVAAARIPLVLNAADHLDSDLAVDGLSLLDATRGDWRWHYPGTPHMGSLPILLSYVQARIWGATPITLVSGGVLAYIALVVACFALNRRAFGSSAAISGLVPLAFASTGTIWLAGRITGGHLLTAAWHAGAFALLVGCLREGGAWRAALLGFWSGLGLFLDSMSAVTIFGLMVATLVHRISRRVGEPRRNPPGQASPPDRWASPRLTHSTRMATVIGCGLLAFGLGIAPRFIGAWADPHDAYREQFEPVTRADVLAEHGKILLLDCLPRLIAGHRLPGLQAEPMTRETRTPAFNWLGAGVSAASLGLFGWALFALATDRDPDPARRAIRWGLMASSAAVVAGFVANRNIFNSDNYRYLVFLLVPWSSGFGLAMGRLASTKPWAAGLIALGFAALMTADSARWYERLGWLNHSNRPIQKPVDDPALAWLGEHPEASAILGDYWDVYRLAFLTGGRVAGVPFPEYPDRFPEIRRTLPGGRPRFLIITARPGSLGPAYRARALTEGGREIFRGPGLSIVDWPTVPGAKP